MINLLNPLFLALSRALREDESTVGDGWNQMLDRRELGHNPEQMNSMIGAPIYMPELFSSEDQHPN